MRFITTLSFIKNEFVIIWSFIVKRKWKLSWVLIPPIILTLGLFFYFFRAYQLSNPEVPIDNKKEDSRRVFDPLGVKNIFPNFIGENLMFVLCLNNRNVVNYDNNVVSIDTLPPELHDAFKRTGAMSIHASEIEGYEIYKLVGENECKFVDMEKLLASEVSSEINNGLPTLYFTEENMKDLSAGKQVEVPYTSPYIDLSKTWLYARMAWSNLVFILASSFLAWFGIVLLLAKVWEFIKNEE